MSANVIESYLVSLGFQVQNNELKKFELAMKSADDIATRHTTGIIGQFVKWQSAIVGGFAAVGLATVGLMDKVADADLGFKLTAQRMFLSVDAARALTLATKHLGFSLEDIAWNPELHTRFEKLMQDQQKLTQGLGPGFETTMQHIRDVRFEVTRMQVALEYIAMNVVQKVFLAFGGEGFFEKIKKWAQWIIDHAPEISDWITRVLVPILKDALHVLNDVWKVTEALARSFVRLIGAISGDKQLEKGALTFENMGKAIDKAADYMVRFVDAVTSAELVVIDLFNALVRLSQWDFKGAAGDAHKAGTDLTKGGAGVLGVGVLGAILGAKTIGGLFAALRGLAGLGAAEGGLGLVGGAAAAGGIGLLGVGAGIGLEHWDKSQSGKDFRSSLGLSEDPAENRARIWGWITGKSGAAGTAITAAAHKYGIDPAIAAAVAFQESHGRQFNKDGSLVHSDAGALGMFQLMPSTAKGLGVNPADTGQNIDGGVRLLSQLLKKYGNVQEALAAYNWGEGNLDKSLKRHGGFSLDSLPAETRNYVRSIEGSLGGDVSIQATINVHGTNATPDQIKNATRDGIAEAMNRKNRNDLVNAQGVYS